MEVTGLLDLGRGNTTCPQMRVIVRRELPHPGATLDAFEVRDGFRYQALSLGLPRRAKTDPCTVSRALLHTA